MPTLVVGMYAPFGDVGVCRDTTCMPWAFMVALWHVEDATMGADIVTTGVETYDSTRLYTAWVPESKQSVNSIDAANQVLYRLTEQSCFRAGLFSDFGRPVCGGSHGTSTTLVMLN